MATRHKEDAHPGCPHQRAAAANRGGFPRLDLSLRRHSSLPNLSRTPTLIMCGTVDRVTPPHHSAAIAAAVFAAELVDVPGAGHMLMLDRPDVVNDRLDALLQRARRELAPRPPTPAARAVAATGRLPLAA